MIGNYLLAYASVILFVAICVAVILVNIAKKRGDK